MSVYLLTVVLYKNHHCKENEKQKNIALSKQFQNLTGKSQKQKIGTDMKIIKLEMVEIILYTLMLHIYQIPLPFLSQKRQTYTIYLSVINLPNSLHFLSKSRQNHTKYLSVTNLPLLITEQDKSNYIPHCYKSAKLSTLLIIK